MKTRNDFRLQFNKEKQLPVLVTDGTGYIHYSDDYVHWLEELVMNSSTPKQLLPIIEKVFGPGAAKGCAERLRQIQVEGWTPEHDDLSTDGSLSLASAMYIMSEEQRLEELSKTNNPMVPPTGWPWLVEYWKPTPDNRIRELEKGVALGMAEIDRLERKEGKK